MEAEQYTSEPTSKLLHCIAVSEYPQSAWHTHRRDNRAVKAVPLKANAQFIRPFDLGVHTFKEKPLLVNWPVVTAWAYKKLRSSICRRTDYSAAKTPLSAAIFRQFFGYANRSVIQRIPSKMI